MKEKMTTCKVCGADIASNPKACPNCGAKNKKPIHKRVWFWILIVFLSVGIISIMTQCSASTPQDETKSETQSEQTKETSGVIEKDGFEVVGEITSESDGYNRYICGTIKNNNSKTASYVQVDFSLYDDSGNMVGSTFDNINNLEPGATWKFKALIFEENATKFKFADITGW